MKDDEKAAVMRWKAQTSTYVIGDSICVERLAHHPRHPW